MKTKSIKIRIIRYLIIGVVPALLIFTNANTQKGHSVDHLLSAVTPWNSIGGCGAGGSGGAGSSAPWMGQGISGKIIDLEVRVNSSNSIVPKKGMSLSSSYSIPITVFYNLPASGISLAMPFSVAKRIDAAPLQTAGMGDISLSIYRNLGMAGHIKPTIALTIPTGKYAIHDLNHDLVPTDFQKGKGIFSSNFGVDYSKFFQWGFINAGIGYNAGFATLSSKEDVWDDELGRAEPISRKFGFSRTSGKRTVLEENDSFGFDTLHQTFVGVTNPMGVVVPDAASFFLYGAIRNNRFTHSLGFSASVPMSPGAYTKTETEFNRYNTQEDANNFIANENSSSPEGYDNLTYFTYHNPYNEEWVVVKGEKHINRGSSSLTFSYGMEIADKENQLPLFWAISVPFQLGKEWGVAGFGAELGVKFGVY